MGVGVPGLRLKLHEPGREEREADRGRVADEVELDRDSLLCWGGLGAAVVE
jgi:hypothetical protein